MDSKDFKNCILEGSVLFDARPLNAMDGWNILEWQQPPYKN